MIFTLAKDTLWANTGHILSWDQIKMPWAVADMPAEDPAGMNSLSRSTTSSQHIVTGTNFQVAIGKTSGSLESFVYQGTQLLAGNLASNFWRAPTDNDNGNNMPSRQGVWKTAGSTRTVDSITVSQPMSAKVVISADFTLPGVNNSDYNIVYTIYGNGNVHVQATITPTGSLPDLPRFGTQLAMPAKYNQIQWFGLGPWETYWDRKTCGIVGVYNRDIEDFIYNYIEPQENANRSDVRWMKVTDSNGFGLQFKGDTLLMTSAWPYTIGQLEAADHPNELPRGNTTVNIDYKQMGVGGDDSWGARPHPEYTLPANKQYTFGYTISVVSAAVRSSRTPLSPAEEAVGVIPFFRLVQIEALQPPAGFIASNRG